MCILAPPTQVIHAICLRMMELSKWNQFTFSCMSTPPILATPPISPVARVPSSGGRDRNHSKDSQDEEGWVVVTCATRERSKREVRRQQPCCMDREEHYFLSLLSCCDCLHSDWTAHTITLLEVTFDRLLVCMHVHV